MTRKQRRLTLIGAAGVVLVAATGLTLSALSDEIVFFNSPSDLEQNGIVPGQRIRLGGLVEEGSVRRDGTTAQFDVTDLANAVPVVYVGILPDLFREGQGIVAEGAFDEAGVFQATNVLAKHDENYMPPEVADSLREAGLWEGDNPATAPAEAPAAAATP